MAEIFAGRREGNGKNVLAQNLAECFERPAWDISFHVNMDAAALIGSDTFRIAGYIQTRTGVLLLHKAAALGFSMKLIWQE
ncbi:MAG: hypothetical protein ACLU70_13570 [Lachnospira sp.]